MTWIRPGAVGLALALLLSGCGGEDQPTASSTTQPPTSISVESSAPESPADMTLAAAATPKAADLTAAAQNANPNRTNKKEPEATNFAGNPDIRAEREQCGAALAKAPADTGAADGPNLLLPDPMDAKTLSVASQVRVVKDRPTAEARIARLKDPATIACMQNVMQERVQAERIKRGIDDKALVVDQTIEPLALPGLGSKTVALRFHLVLTLTGGPSVNQYVDLLVTYVDRVQIAMTVESSDVPPSMEFDTRLIDQVRGNAVRAATP